MLSQADLGLQRIGMETESREEETENSSSLQQYSGLPIRTKTRHRIVTKAKIRRKLQISVDSTYTSSNNSYLGPSLYNGSDVVSCNDSGKITFTRDNSTSDNSALKTDIKCQDTNLDSSLISWSHEHNISHSALNDLLKLLKPYHQSLPKDSRTLLQTPTKINIVQCSGGAYIYFELLVNILERASSRLIEINYPIMDMKMSQLQIESNSFLSVTINVDGL